MPIKMRVTEINSYFKYVVRSLEFTSTFGCTSRRTLERVVGRGYI